MTNDGIERENKISWHSHDISYVFERLNTQDGGLTSNEAKRRLVENGPNILPVGKIQGIFGIFLNQFKSPLIYVLIVAAIVVTLLGEIMDGAIIFFVLFVNALV